MAHATSAITVAADHMPALHNCGPSPMSVYRTAPVGVVHVLDLFGELCASALVPRALRPAFAPREAEFTDHLPMPEFLPAPVSTPDVVVPLVHALLAKLPVSGNDAAKLPTHDTPPAKRGVMRRLLTATPATPSTEQDALHAIGQLAAVLRALGALVPVHGLVTSMPREETSGSPFASWRANQPLPWLAGVQADYAKHAKAIRLAWMVCAFSYAAPPLVLFSRTPSLRYWRGDGGLLVRWFGPVEVQS